MEYFTPEILYMDNVTYLGARLEFAKVCVEINFSSSFSEKVELVLLSGDFIDVGVEYA